LTNADMDSASPFALVLVGQPTLRQRLRLGALDQRVALRYALPPMSQPDTADYIAHHVKLAGRSDTLFSTMRWPASTRRRGACPGRSTTSPCKP
jgi:type II secretory pathway predicted ATPase ExeA